MRADISRSLCDPGLPSGTANTPGVSPNSSRRRKTSHQRIRTSSTMSAAGGPYHISQAPPCGSLPPVSDPKTLQEKRELIEYFQKLRVLVPSLPKTGKIPKLEVIEHVITYIKQLENQLIDHPMIHVLENNAYISGLLQSMAPEFDISHLFPSRVPHAGQSSSSHAHTQLQYTSDTQSLPHNSYSMYGTEESSVAAFQASNSLPASPSKLKARKSSVRKPLTLLSATCPK